MRVEPIKDKELVRDIFNELKKENTRNAILFGLGVFTGLRGCDIRNLRVKDVKHKWNLHVKEIKTGFVRDIPLNRELKKMIDNYTENMNDYEYLIKSRKGVNRPISGTQFYRIMQEIADYFGLEHIGTHSLRKTFAYHLYKDNKNHIGLVQDILGHESSSTTLRYIGVDKELCMNAIKKLKY